MVALCRGSRTVTIQPPRALFSISYRLEPHDDASMRMAISRPAPARLAFEITCYLLAVIVLALGIAGSLDGGFATFADAFSMPLALLSVPLVLAGPVILALRPQIAGFAAILLYPLNPAAGREVVIELTSHGIVVEAGSASFSARWASVTSLIETSTHLFVQTGPGDAVIIPRRAVGDEDAYRNLRGFIRARTGLPTRLPGQPAPVPVD